MSMLPTDKWTPGGGMFGGGDIKGKLQAILASYLAAQGNPAGALFLRDRMQGKQDERQARIQEQQYQRQRQDSLVDYEAKQKIEQQYAPPPQPDQFERSLINSGIQPGSPEWAKAWERKRELSLNPMIMTPYGPMPYSQVNPAAPTAPVGKLTPIDGGPTPGASGGFPLPF